MERASAYLRQRWLFVALLVLFVAACIPYCFKANHASAFVRWHNQIRELDGDEDIYQRHAYPNPPIMAIILWPLTALPPAAGAICWYWIKVVLTLLAIHWSFRMVETIDRPLPSGAKLLIVALALRAILGDLLHGNVNLFILFLLTGSLFAFLRGRDFLSGSVLALAIACKVTPILFIPYFAWKRAWKTLAGCSVGLLLFLLIIPGSLLGWERNLQLLTSWTQQMAEPYLVAGKVQYTEHANQSLAAVVLRLTTASPSFSTWEGDTSVPVRFDNLLNLEIWQANLVSKACLFAFVGLVLFACRTPISAREGWRLPAEFALIMLGMLLFSERTWKHHCVTQLLAFTVLVAECSASNATWKALAIWKAAPLKELLGKVRSFAGLWLPGGCVVHAMQTKSTLQHRKRLQNLSSPVEWINVGGNDGASTVPSKDRRIHPALMFGVAALLLNSVLVGGDKLPEVYGVYAWANILLVIALVISLRSPTPLEPFEEATCPTPCLPASLS